MAVWFIVVVTLLVVTTVTLFLRTILLLRMTQTADQKTMQQMVEAMMEPICASFGPYPNV